MKFYKPIRILLAAGMLAVATSAGAADTTVDPSISLQAQSPWQIRLRALGVIPRDSGRFDGIDGSGLSFSNTVIPELDVSYFFNDNIAVELILGTTKSTVHGQGSISSLGNIGKTWMLPPTLTLQYHVTSLGAFRPYVGAGINYTMFYNQSGNSADSLNVKNTFGVAFQAGFDYMLDQHWGLNVDVKKLILRPDFDATVGGSHVSGKANLDPLMIGTGITYRF
ncbi:OmpW family protein [Rhizobium sp. L245/93]|uniref:OmpW/AlkL family protein n=1 Tax=Rhizobium sp. L245/93 TaxID=2819998 RepID=UPI001ADC40B5|nr:OmpW family protein [Rhizobium sp. L245/93]MBO9167466.1 OmpW family protein [Rhizobium sp. L245/93]